VAIGAPPCMQAPKAAGRATDAATGPGSAFADARGAEEDAPTGRAGEDSEAGGGADAAGPGVFGGDDSGTLGVRARFLLVVNDCDVVPRLLGSPMPLSIATMLASACSTTGTKAVMERNVALLETMQLYSHPQGTDALLLRDGSAKFVPSGETSSVLHLHEALSPTLLDAHGCDSYTNALEMASAMAEAFDDS
jgi:hypothetical protein